MHPIVSDGNQTIFYGSDLFPTAAHIPAQWVMSYDIQPMVSIKEKQKLLKKMFQKNWILFFEHDPYNELVSLKNTDKGIRLDNSFKIKDYF